MSCRGCNASIDCGDQSDVIFPYSLTPGSPFPYVINCPEGVNCNEALSITMNCCGTPITANVPAGASLDERAAIVQQLVTQCAFIESGCSNPPPGTPEPPTIPPGSRLFFSRSQRVTSNCSSTYGGGTYTYTLEAGRFVGRTQSEADSLARAFANATVAVQKFCLNAPCLCPCADVATTLNINTVGGTGPFSYEITSGTLPTGLSLAFFGGVLRASGTPTVAGNSTITVKVYDSLGGYLTKSLTFYVIEITPSFLSDGTVGVEYSEQLDVDGGIGPFAFSISDGELPDGLTLSDEGLISGTPTEAGDFTFTVLAVDTGLTGHEGCSKEYEVEIAAATVALGPGMAPAYSADSDIVHGGFAESAPSTSGPISTRRVPEMTANQVLGLKLNGGSAWCPDNNKFYHGCAPASGDVMAIVIDPLTSSTTPIGGFSTGPGVNGGRAFYHPTLADIWLRFGNAGNGFARITTLGNAVTYVACASPTDFTYCPSNDCIYFTDGGSIYKIDTTGLVTTVFTESDFETLAGQPVTNWLIGSIEYVDSLDRVMFAIRYFLPSGSVWRQQLWKITPASGAATFATIAGSSGSVLPPWATIMWYSTDFDRLIVLQGSVTSSYNPSNFASAAANLTGHVLTARGCYCDSVNKIALPTLNGGTYDLRFFAAAALG